MIWVTVGQESTSANNITTMKQSPNCTKISCDILHQDQAHLPNLPTKTKIRHVQIHKEFVASAIEKMVTTSIKYADFVPLCPNVRCALHITDIPCGMEPGQTISQGT